MSRSAINSAIKDAGGKAYGRYALYDGEDETKRRQLALKTAAALAGALQEVVHNEAKADGDLDMRMMKLTIRLLALLESRLQTGNSGIILLVEDNGWPFEDEEINPLAGSD